MTTPVGPRVCDLQSEALRDPGLMFSMPGVGLRALVDEAARDHGIALEPAVELRSQRALMAMVALVGA